MAVIGMVKGEFYVTDKGIEIGETAVHAKIITPHSQAAKFSGRIIEIERNTVAILIEVIISTNEHFFCIITETGCTAGAAGKRIYDFAEIPAGAVITGSLAASVTPEHPIFGAILYPAAARTLIIVGAANRRKISAYAGVHPFVMPADGINNAADGAAAVEQGRGPFYYFDPFNSKNV